MIITKRSYARVGFVGNPSDGYNGKTIAFTIGDFCAEVLLYESPRLEFKPSPQDGTVDQLVFTDATDLIDHLERSGYYGGVRLLKAATRCFVEHCTEVGVELPESNFTIQYTTSVPRQVGLGGSSAIVTAVMRALMAFYGVQIPDQILPGVVLQVESRELGLTAGLQDRVIQAYGGLVYMDFAKEYMARNGHGRYERLDPATLPPFYLAYRKDLGQESSTAHLRVRERYDLGDEKVVKTMAEIASLADRARELLGAEDHDGLAEVLNRNFDLRARVFDIQPEDRRMVETARAAGASCKFCGSGGAVVGTFKGAEMLERLRHAMEEAGYEFVVPEVAPNSA